MPWLMCAPSALQVADDPKRAEYARESISLLRLHRRV
jgi:hypothetical protein